MPAPASLAFLPKPVLFGLYGAIGGLLGALVFGEPVWQLFPPPPPSAAKPKPQVAIGAPNEVQLIAGKTNTFGVEIARAEFDGAVQVKVEDLPSGIQADPLTIDKGQTKGTVVLRASGSTPSATKSLKVTAASTNDKSLEADTSISLQVIDPGRPQADVVFVLDVTGSMDWAIYGIRDGIQSFASQMDARNIDFQVGLVAFRDLTNPDDERAGFPLMQDLLFDGSTFTRDVGRFRAEVSKLRATGGGDIPESSLEAVVRASDFKFRPTATKVLLLITDAPPKVKPRQKELQSNAEEKAAVAKAAEHVRERGIDAVHLVVRSASGDGTDDEKTYAALMEVGTGKGGQFFDLRQTADRGAAGFTFLIDRFTSAVVEAAAAKNPTTPVATGAAGAPVLTTTSLQSSQKYAEGSEGRLLVLSAVWTGAISALVCLLLLAGQHHYLRGSLPPGSAIAVGLVGGLVVGLLGGACGYGLYLLSPQGSFFDAIFRIFGWSLLGGLAGTGLSLFIPNLKWVHGLAGGAIGGAAGAVGFMVANGVIGQAIGGSAGDAVGRLAGGLVLGACIGLMVALVEAAFRRAWLEVRYGSRETISVNLGPEPVKIGGDNRACTVWARGAVPVALRYFIRGGQVVCEDAPNRKEMVVGNGDVREVGNVMVTVRTGSDSSAPPAHLARPTPAPPAPRPPAPPKPQPAEVLELPPDEDDLVLAPMAPTSKPLGPPAPPASPAAAPKVSPPRPPVPGTAVMPPRPPAPTASPSRPPSPTISPPRPPGAPAPGGAKPVPSAPSAAKPNASAPASPRDPDACPSCGRKNPGRPGARYCMLCERTY